MVWRCLRDVKGPDHGDLRGLLMYGGAVDADSGKEIRMRLTSKGGCVRESASKETGRYGAGRSRQSIAKIESAVTAPPGQV